VKTCEAGVEALRKKESQGKLSLSQKLMVFWGLPPTRPPFPWMNGNVLFCRFFWISSCLWPNLGLWCYVFLTLQITL
jgi:hypothetical protein